MKSILFAVGAFVPAVLAHYGTEPMPGGSPGGGLFPFPPGGQGPHNPSSTHSPGSGPTPSSSCGPVAVTTVYVTLDSCATPPPGGLTPTPPMPPSPGSGECQCPPVGGSPPSPPGGAMPPFPPTNGTTPPSPPSPPTTPSSSPPPPSYTVSPPPSSANTTTPSPPVVTAGAALHTVRWVGNGLAAAVVAVAVLA